MRPEKPRHLGVIMDGNRRWARRHGLRSLVNGHEEGAEKLIELCAWCIGEGIPFLSVYAFSTENWNRAAEEVEGLMRLMKTLFAEKLHVCEGKGIRVRIAGNRALLPGDVRKVVESAEERTRTNAALTLQIALSYGGRDEIVRAAQSLCRDAAEGRLAPEALDEALFAARLDTAGMPDIDLVVRTGGQSRLSNFFPWQSIYAELYFTDALWPDFSREMFLDAIGRFGSAAANHGR